MQILTSPLYEEQLKEILEPMAVENFEDAKKFKIYLDTIIVNIPTKAKKYKKSVFFDDENIKDVEYENFTIPVFIDGEDYVVLGIVSKS